MLRTTPLYNIPPRKIKITTQESILKIPINCSPEGISATVLFRHKSVLEMGMGWPLGPESPGSVSEIKQRLSCVRVETDVPSHRAPGIVCSSYLPKATADQEIVQRKPIKNIKVAVVIAVIALTITEHLLSTRHYSTCFTCIKSFTLTIA